MSDPTPAPMRLRTLLYHPYTPDLTFPETTADGVMFDLEDGVHPSSKDEARAAITGLLSDLGPVDAHVFVRINEVSSEVGRTDLEAVLASGATENVLVPMVRSLEDVIATARVAEAFWERTGTKGVLKLWPVIETALGVQAVDDIARGPYVCGLSVGPADLGADLGLRSISRSPWDWPQDMVYAKQRAVVAARAACIGIVDGGWRAVEDSDGLRTRAAASAQMGFDGMITFDEVQVPIVTKEFSPSDEEVAWAQRVLAVVAELDQAGEAPRDVDGEVIEMPNVRVAEDIMARAAT